MVGTFISGVAAAMDTVGLFLLDTVLKATVLLILACVAAASLRRASAAVRHRVWCLAFLGLLLLPVLLLALPAWRLPVLPALAISAAAPRENFAVEAPAVALGREDSARTDPSGDPADSVSRRDPAMASVAASTGNGDDLAGLVIPDPSDVGWVSDPSRMAWKAILPVLWLIGLAWSILPVAVTPIYKRLLVKSARPVVDAEPCRLLAELCRSLNVRRRVRVLEIDRPVVPMTWGLLRPIVLVPLAWREWPVERQRIVLLHELAHVKRLDPAFQLLARLACALYWFHPLVWHALRRLRIERESACDDCVLMTGERPSEYARQLVAIARDYHPAAVPVAVAMVQSSSFERRIRALLDKARSHLPISRMAGRLALIFGALVLAGVSIVGPASTAQPQDNAASVSTVESLAESKTVAPPTAPTTSHALGKAIETERLNVSRPKQQVKEQASPRNTSAREITVRGTVLLPDGRPAPGATVRAAVGVWAMLVPIMGKDAKPPSREAKADSEGQFTISFTTQPYGDLSRLDPFWSEIWKKTEIAASAPGYGPAWLRYEDIPPDKPLVLRLVPDLPIRGRIVDSEGRPVAGLAIKVGDLWAAASEDLTPWLTAAKAGELPWTLVKRAPKEIDPELVGVPKQVITDPEGRFEIRGVGRERHLDLTFVGETVAHRSIGVATRKMEPFERVISTPPFAGTEPVYGAEFTFTASPSLPIVGTVRDAKTGQSLAGVSVESYKLAGYPYANHRVLKSTTDQQGRFRLIGMPKGKGNSLLAVPNDDQPYLMREVKLPELTGPNSLTADIALDRGIWITGRVTDKSTGQAVRARLHYLPFRSNQFARALPEFDEHGNTHGDQMRYQTRADGSYRLVGLPGRAIVGAQSVLRQYRVGVGSESIQGLDKDGHFHTYRNPIDPGRKWPNVMKEINPPADAQSVAVDFEMDPGRSVRVSVVDPQGRPIAGVNIQGAASDGYAQTISEPTFAVANLSPGEVRTIVFHHEERKLGWVMRLKADEAGPQPISVRLQPVGTLRARLLHPDGAPATGTEVEILVLPTGDFSKRLFGATTDIQGRFECTLLPGAAYSLLAQGAGIEIVAEVARDVSIEPGQLKDLGDVTLRRR